MSKKNENTESAAPVVATPAATVDAPKAITAALSRLAQASEKEKMTYKDTAIATRKWGRETTLKPEEIRLALAKSIAQGFGVDLDTVTTSPKKFKIMAGKSTREVSLNGTLYSLRSTLVGIATPATDERKAAVDSAIEDADSTWQDIVAASRSGGNAGAGEKKNKTAVGADKPVSEEQIGQKVAMLVSSAKHAEIPAQNVWDIIVAAAQEQMKKDYPNADVKFVIP